ncbi:MAG: HEAT repeat domain-containing protein [Bradymonadaceae bacterium]
MALLANIPNPQARMAELEHQLELGETLVLFEGLADTYPPLRRLAARELAHNLTPEFEDYLRALVRGEEAFQEAADTGLPADLFLTPSPEVRSAAVVALRGSEHPATVAALMDAARSEDADIRYHALVSLHHVPVDEARLRPLVEESLNDEDPEVVIVAAQLATHAGWHDLLPHLERLRSRFSGQEDLQIVFSIAELIGAARKDGIEVPDALVRPIVDRCMEALGDEPTTAAASHALATLGDPRATEALEAVLDKWMTHPILKVGAAAALVELGHDRGREYLTKTLQSRRKDARGYALRIVGKLHMKEHLDELIRVARSDDYHADTAVLALCDMDGPEALETLRKISKTHPEDEVRELALRCLRGEEPAT